jgi:large subunit ribosomal protein L9
MGAIFLKVILTQDVKALGKKDSTVEVNDGYARNFLIPKGLAVEGNATNMNILTNKQNSLAKKAAKELAEAGELKEKLEKKEILLITKAGEHGKLFGSITSKEIVQKITETHGVKIDKRKLDAGETIKTVGNYSVDVKLHPGVIAKIRVKIEAEA